MSEPEYPDDDATRIVTPAPEPGEDEGATRIFGFDEIASGVFDGARAYLFATTNLAVSNPASMKVMAAVMAAGMVPPIAMAISTAVRPKVYTPAEQENGRAAWLLGASFISEGAIPFAAADPLRVIPSMMVGGAVTGALTMALGVGSYAPHGGVFVFFAILNFLGFLLAIAAGVVVGKLGTAVVTRAELDAALN